MAKKARKSTKFGRPSSDDDSYSSASDDDDYINKGDDDDDKMYTADYSPMGGEDNDAVEDAIATIATLKRKIPPSSMPEASRLPSTPPDGSSRPPSIPNGNCLSAGLSSVSFKNDNIGAGSGIPINAMKDDLEDFIDDDDGGGKVRSSNKAGGGQKGAIGREDSSSSGSSDDEEDGVVVPGTLWKLPPGTSWKKQQYKLSLIPDKAKDELKAYIYPRVFTGGRGTLDNSVLEKICLKYDMNYLQAATFIKQEITLRKKKERLFLENGCNPVEYTVEFYTRKGGPFTRTTKYHKAIREGFENWDGKTPDQVLDDLFEESTDRIKKGKEPPNLRPPGAIKKVHRTHRKMSEAMVTAIEEGRATTQTESFGEAQREIMDEFYGGNVLVKVFKIINGDIPLEDAEVSFNVNHSDPSAYRGWTISSGGGHLATKVMENHKFEKSDWYQFVEYLRRYGVREDVCNPVGQHGRDINSCKFIFYHDGMHPDGLAQLKEATHLSETIFHDKEE